MRIPMVVLGILLLTVGAIGARTARPQNTPKPLSVADVEHGLTSAVPNARMAALIKQYGVDFELTRGLEGKLRNSGANDSLIRQIRHSRIRIEARSVGLTPHVAVEHPHHPTNTVRTPAHIDTKELLSQADKYRAGASRSETKAAQLYRKAAEMGNAEAQTKFAEALFDGRGVPRDPAASRLWLEKAARQGNARAQCELGVMLTSGLNTAPDRANGLHYLQAAARQGDAYAEDYLGQLSETGLVGDPSSSEAYMHYLKAAEMGSAWGTYNVARMNEHGIGVYPNPTEALRWYMKTASMRSKDLPGQWSDLRSEAGAMVAANFRIGDMYAGGIGVPADNREADKWYQHGVDMATTGARSEWLTAQVYLANAYLQSKGVPLDYAEAMHWMKTAAENGNRQAQVNLGTMYRDGQGTTQSYGEAMYWYRKATDQGSAVAEWMVGRLYFDGKGVTRDFNQAATWFRKAAAEGVPAAQWDLGMMYYHGYGVSKDLETARTWMQKAAARGYEPAKEMLAKT